MGKEKASIKNNRTEETMPKQARKTTPPWESNGFSITELIVTSAIAGVLASVAIPLYNNANQNAILSEVKATVVSIPPIISAFIDETGEKPTTWDDLSSIAVVMTRSGPATGELTKQITLPNSGY